MLWEPGVLTPLGADSLEDIFFWPKLSVIKFSWCVNNIKVLYLFYFVCFCCKMFEHFLNYCLVYTQDLYVLLNWLPSILLPFGESLSLVVCTWLGRHLSGSLCMLHSITLLCILLSQGEYTVTIWPDLSLFLWYAQTPYSLSLISLILLITFNYKIAWPELSLQSRAKRVETLYLFQIFFHSRTSLFSFPLPPISMLSRSQNLLENLAYSTLKRGRGKSTGFNAILLKTRNISEIVANFGWVSQPFCMGL